MTSVRTAGFYRELTHGHADGPSLLDTRTEGPNPHEAQIFRYLSEAPTVCDLLDVAVDVFDPTIEIGPLSLRSDGVWLWPSDLAYYAVRYRVAVDPGFLAHMEARNWRPPAEGDVDVSPESLGMAEAEWPSADDDSGGQPIVSPG